MCGKEEIRFGLSAKTLTIRPTRTCTVMRAHAGGLHVSSSPAVAPCHDLEFIQPALECSVPKRRTGRGFEANQLGQPQVGGKHIAAPAGEFLLQRVAQLRVEAR